MRTISLATLKKAADACGAELLVLRPGRKLPASLRGRTGHKLWLCVMPGTDRAIVSAAACRFDEVYFLTGKGTANEMEKQ